MRLFNGEIVLVPWPILTGLHRHDRCLGPYSRPLNGHYHIFFGAQKEVLLMLGYGIAWILGVPVTLLVIWFIAKRVF